MNGALTLLTRYWPFVALAVSAAMLTTAHIFENMGYAPCTLCLHQREVYWVAMALAAAGLIMTRMLTGWRFERAMDAALALVFLFGAGLAFYHSGVEWHWWPGPQACATTGATATAAGLEALLGGTKFKPPACDTPNWWFLGLTMANWNTLVSLGLAASGALATIRGRHA